MEVKRVRRTIFEFVFDPLPWLDGASRATLETLLLEQRGNAGTFWPNARAKRCRDRWAIAMPLGSFYGSFGPAVTQAMEDEAREALLAYIRSVEPGVFTESRGVVRHEGLVYCPLHVLSALRRYAKLAPLFEAAHAFVAAAWEKPELIRGKRTGKGSHRPLAERDVVDPETGRLARSSNWSAEEDLVLRKWFSVWPDGQRHVLTEEHWKILLDKQLQNRRTKASVIGRLHFLNNKLRWSLTAPGNFKGKLPAKALEQYVKQMLGQRVRIPRGMGRLRDIIKKPKVSLSPFDPAD